jgi:hypothetical protein
MDIFPAQNLTGLPRLSIWPVVNCAINYCGELRDARPRQSSPDQSALKLLLILVDRLETALEIRKSCLARLT